MADCCDDNISETPQTYAGCAPVPNVDRCRETARVESWAGMVSVIMSNLGSPLVCVELSPAQRDIAIRDAIDFMQQYWSGGSCKAVSPIQLIKGQREYRIEDEGILSAISILGTTESGADDYSDSRPFTMERMIARSIPTPSANAPLNSTMSLSEFESMRQFFKEWEFRYSTPFVPSWDDVSKVLTVEPTPSRNCVAGLHYWKRERILDLFSTLQFRRLATAYAGVQWASNLSKYTIGLPGGANLNAAAMRTDWIAERDRWETQIKNERASYFTVG